MTISGRKPNFSNSTEENDHEKNFLKKFAKIV